MSTRQRIGLILLSLLLILAFPLGHALLFVVNERELAVVLRFGEPVASYTEPGLYVKAPFVDEVRRLPKTYQFWSADGGEILVDLPTADGKKVEVTPWAMWKITDPLRFVEVLRTLENAETRVQTFVRGEMRDVITANDLSEVVRSTDRKLTYSFQVGLQQSESAAPKAPSGEKPAEKAPAPVEAPTVAPPEVAEKIHVGREEIVAKIKEVVQQRLRTEQGVQGGRGIEVVDVGIARIDFVPLVQEAAFQRLIAFMESIASFYTNEGERRKQEILNRTEAEVQKILGEGKEQANTIRGEVEAEIIDSYAKAITETGEFYNFVRTLEVYQKALQGNTRLILTTDSGLLQLLKQGVSGSGAAASPAANGAQEKP